MARIFCFIFSIFARIAGSSLRKGGIVTVIFLVEERDLDWGAIGLFSTLEKAETFVEQRKQKGHTDPIHIVQMGVDVE